MHSLSKGSPDFASNARLTPRAVQTTLTVQRSLLLLVARSLEASTFFLVAEDGWPGFACPADEVHLVQVLVGIAGEKERRSGSFLAQQGKASMREVAGLAGMRL